MTVTECYIQIDPKHEIEVPALSAGSTIENAWMPGYMGIEEIIDWDKVLKK
jgi:hypothetical protein